MHQSKSLLLEQSLRFVFGLFCFSEKVCLFVWVLCHINLYRLFNAKSIFIQIKQFYFKQFSLVKCQICSVGKQKIILFQIVPFSISMQFKNAKLNCLK